jgi:hypothetical protein
MIIISTVKKKMLNCVKRIKEVLFGKKIPKFSICTTCTRKEETDLDKQLTLITTKAGYLGVLIFCQECRNLIMKNLSRSYRGYKIEEIEKLFKVKLE